MTSIAIIHAKDAKKGIIRAHAIGRALPRVDASHYPCDSGPVSDGGAVEERLGNLGAQIKRGFIYIH